MIRLGTAFVIAGILGSGADLLIRSYLNNVADIEAVGFYNSAYMMTMVYAGMVFRLWKPIISHVFQELIT